MAQLRIGVDVGGTKTEVCILSYESFDRYRILAKDRMPTHRNQTFEDFVARLEQLLLRLLVSTEGKPELKDVAAIGIGLPGSIDPATQHMLQGSVPFLKHRDFPSIFRAHLGFDGPVLVENDANCFALAECYLGAGRRWAAQQEVPMDRLCMIGVILGTGVGGGLIVNGTLIRGGRGGAGEIGHMTLVESGRPCYCGKRGCAEQYLAGPGFEHSYASRTAAREALGAKQIFQKVEEGDPLALANLEYYRDHLVTYLSNLANCLDPHLFVLGGGMSCQERIYPGISERLSRECFLTENPPAVLQNACGDSAGVLGAALLGNFRKDNLAS